MITNVAPHPKDRRTKEGIALRGQVYSMGRVAVRRGPEGRKNAAVLSAKKLGRPEQTLSPMRGERGGAKRGERERRITKGAVGR